MGTDAGALRASFPAFDGGLTTELDAERELSSASASAGGERSSSNSQKRCRGFCMAPDRVAPLVPNDACTAP
jgi:hypothetical protein